jgi:hypothetical protein
MTGEPESRRAVEIPFSFTRAIFAGGVLGLILSLWALSPRIQFSRRKAYDEVYAGMTRAQAVNVLSMHSVECALTEPAEQSNVCRFTDAWRSYLIAVDSRTGRVGRKDMASRGPISLDDIIKARH